MLADHAGRILFPEVKLLTVIGRLAFPLFAYMIAEGCRYTRNKKKYVLIMAGLAVGCQAVYFVADRSLYMNVLFTLVLSVLLIFSVDNFLKKKNVLSFSGALGMSFLAVFLTLILPELLSSTDYKIDYSLAGVLIPVAVYFAPKGLPRTAVFAVMLCVLSLDMGGIQWFSLLCVPLVMLYNGKRGRLRLRWLFYIFYPSHLAVLYLISLLIK